LPANDQPDPERPPQDAAAQDNTPPPQEEERREYFRVEDRVILRYLPVPRENVGQRPAESHFDNSEVFGLMRELRAVDHENNNVLRGLAEHNRELGLYLKGLNRKIELVADALAALDRFRQGTLPQAVSLCEGGIAFVAGEPLAVGATMALELILLPQHTALALYGEIVDNRDELPPRIAVAFLRLRDSDRQVLARHILQVQIAVKRQHQPT
jgi:hypothetical protein